MAMEPATVENRILEDWLIYISMIMYEAPAPFSEMSIHLSF